MPGTLTGRLNGRDRDRDQPSAQGKQNSGKIPVHFVGARGARARFTDGVREHPRRRTHPGASTDNAGTRTRGVSGRAASRVRIRQRPLQGQLERATRYARSAGPARMGQRGCRWCDQHTHTYTHIQAQAFVGLDRFYLSIFRVKNEVSVAKIASIILSIFRVKTIDYRFRFLE